MNKRIVARFVSAIALVALASLSALSTPARASADQTYIVLFAQSASPADTAGLIQAAGGTLAYNYDMIGVAIARSSSATFRDSLLADGRVENAAPTRDFAIRMADSLAADDGADAAPVDLTSAPAADSDNLSGLQWDMRQIHTPEAHAISGGSRDVVVGDIDSGLDYRHPDLAPNVDFANSVSCMGGVPNTDPAAWDDDNGHGTHTAGTIAAASNGIGIVGVAPNVRLAGIKAAGADGFFYPEAVVCSFVWAGTHNIDVTNNSYFADPYLYNCRNDPVQRAIWKAEQRAIRFAMSRGVTVVASAGNENQDLAHPTVDLRSPSDGTPVPREVTNACIRIPAEIPGVITVTANGARGQKSYYSDYGIGVVQVTAPGGDRRFQVTPAAVNGRVLSTYPRALTSGSLAVYDCSVSPCATYLYAQGTSMAGPHAAGVAALLISQRGKLSPGTVQALLNQTSDAVPCPANPFNPGGTGAFLASCQGGGAYNSFYGHGQINALSAVSR